MKQRNLRQQKRPQNQLPQRSSPNLFPEIEQTQIIKHHDEIATYAKAAIIFLQLIFIIVLGINFKIYNDIQKLEKDLKAQANTSSRQKDKEVVIKDVIKKTNNLKRIEGSRVELSGLAREIFDTNQEAEIIGAAINAETVSIEIETNSPLQVSLIISKYFESGLTNEITLKTAFFNKAEGSFVSSMEMSVK